MSGGKRRGRAACLALLLALALLGGTAAAGRREDAAASSSAEGKCYVALTFDDGPRRSTTTRLLEGLSQRGVHATFFVIGLSLEGNEDLILRMAEEGHQVGIHSQNHKMLTELSGDALYWEVDQLRHTLTGLLSGTDFMVRPPYGMTNQAVLQAVDAPVILWDVDPEDWADENTDRQVAHIVSCAKDGDIILLHDIYPSSVDTALRVVDELMARGFCFVTVEELFAIKGIEPEKGRIYRSLSA